MAWTARLPSDLDSWLDREAARCGVSKSALATRLLRDAMERGGDTHEEEEDRPLLPAGGRIVVKEDGDWTVDPLRDDD